MKFERTFEHITRSAPTLSAPGLRACVYLHFPRGSPSATAQGLRVVNIDITCVIRTQNFTCAECANAAGNEMR
eukprot:11362287-Alexandrium_andersonii.AAC.1